MTSALYLEHFLDSLEHLPVELQRNFKLMQELDTRAQAVMRDIDAMGDDFMNNVKSMSSEKKKEVMTKIQQQFNKAKELGDDKVQLAIQTYELVDKHIRRLDSDLARFESEIQDKALTSSRALEEQATNQQKRGRKKLKEKEKKKKGASDEEDVAAKSAKKKKSKVGGKGDKTTTDKVAGGLSSSDSPLPVLPLPGTEVLDMPVDPNEPTYCLCHQVSYGEMIGCDNPDCTIEWFHFACVSLTTKPKGKWYCPKCSADRKKK
ncbi:inhibitor of growth protein [Nesidiocoris tenuis]|uniref:Inhibitor of growth protein n=1 Tax=Nesidiocoris tenuis TaxID=355587 RepID=A0ABN7B940_9HEMI|nr:inhibitor of growth protein [Nesidiocoris tenuis]